MHDFERITDALELLATHGGSIQFLKIKDGSTMMQVWFQSADLSASQRVDPADGTFIAKCVVEYVRQFREQWGQRN